MSFTPDLVDPESPLSERLLVCEGPCNPDIRDYDASTMQAMTAITGFTVQSNRETRMMLNTAMEWSRRLKHTMHIPETATAIYRNEVGWCRAWRCTECGHKRYY